MNNELPEQKRVVIKPDQPIVIKPSAETITIRPAANPVVIKPAQSVVIEPKTTQTISVQPSVSVTVKPPQRGAWDERGWTNRTDGGREIYEGFFQVANQKRGETRRFRGRIEIGGWGKKISVFIHNPPPEIKRHRHGPCFQLMRDGWFSLHWSRPARNADDAILYMERILDESLNQ